MEETVEQPEEISNGGESDEPLRKPNVSKKIICPNLCVLMFIIRFILNILAN